MSSFRCQQHISNYGNFHFRFHFHHPKNHRHRLLQLLWILCAYRKALKYAVRWFCVWLFILCKSSSCITHEFNSVQGNHYFFIFTIIRITGVYLSLSHSPIFISKHQLVWMTFYERVIETTTSNNMQFRANVLTKHLRLMVLTSVNAKMLHVNIVIVVILFVQCFFFPYRCVRSHTIKKNFTHSHINWHKFCQRKIFQMENVQRNKRAATQIQAEIFPV